MLLLATSLKATLRQPIKIILFVTLIGLTTFAFTTRAFEGLIVDREILRLSEKYNAVAILVPLEDWEWDVSEVRELLNVSPLVYYTESLRVIPGVMEGIYTPDIDGRSPFPNRLFVYGTLLNKERLQLEMRHSEFYDLIDFSFPHWQYMDIYFFEIEVDTVKASLPEYVQEGDVLPFFLLSYQGMKADVYNSVQIGQRYLVSGQFGYNLILPRAYFGGIPPGISPTDLSESYGLELLLRPLTKDGLYFYEALHGDSVSVAEINHQIEILNNNIHTIFLRTVKDMRTLPDAKMSIFLTEGRFIDCEDYQEERRVAVIRAEFAELRGLSIGDTINVDMRRTPFAEYLIMHDTIRGFPIPGVGRLYNANLYLEYLQDESFEGRIVAGAAGARYDTFGNRAPWNDGILHNGVFYFDIRRLDEIMSLEMATGYITDIATDRGWESAVINKAWMDAEIITEAFEIVGIYGRIDHLNTLVTLSQNNVFIPDSVTPSSWEQQTLYRNLSIMLTHPGKEGEFTLRYQGLLEDMGFWPIFLDSGWSSFNATTEPIRNSIVIGVLIGVIPAWFFAINQAKNTIANIEGAIFERISITSLLLTISALLGLLFIFSAVELSKLSDSSVLELLQGNISKKKPKKRFAKRNSSSSVEELALNDFSKTKFNIAVFSQKPTDKTSSLSTMYMVRTIMRYILRKPISSAISIGVAMGFVLVLSQMLVSIEENLEQVDWLYKTTIVTGAIVAEPSAVVGNEAPISHGVLYSILEMELDGVISNDGELVKTFVNEYYAEGQHLMTMVAIESELPESETFFVEVISFEHILGFSIKEIYEELHGVEFQIEYMNGFDSLKFWDNCSNGALILVSHGFMNQWNVSLGDYLGFIADAAFQPNSRDVKFYQIVGVFDNTGDRRFITNLPNLQNHVGSSLRYDYAQFQLVPSLNRDLEEFRQRVTEIVEQTDPRLIFILRDHILREVVEPLEQNITTMKVLYPIILVLSIFISIGSTALLLLSTMKDVAIMRSLGMTKRHVMLTLGAKHKFLCVIGIVIGGIIAVVNVGSVNVFAAGLYLIGCILTTLVFMIIVLKKKPMELLQVVD